MRGRRNYKTSLVLLIVALLTSLMLGGCGKTTASSVSESVSVPEFEINLQTADRTELGEELQEATASEGTGQTVSEVSEGTSEITEAVEGLSEETALVEPDSVVTNEVASETLENTETVEDAGSEDELLDPSGTYTSKEDVSLYLHTYGELPSNFMTKKEARNLGWEGGSLEAYAPGMCIGGDYFGNYEGLLPEGDYHECDIDTLGKKSRGAKRLIYSDDGRIYYTEDHYESFVLLYGEE